jgi:GntR family transcriptional repressor for pyruvate dehydrogenase complex
MDIKTISISTIPDAIVEQIKKLIHEGNLKPGDRLPNERELGQRFGVGRSSVREALKALNAIGLVERTREGTFVSTDLTKLVWNSLSQTSSLSQNSVREVFEARQIFEISIVAKAAEKATPEIINEIWKWIPDQITNIEEFKYVDVQFHFAIVRATENSFLIEMYKHVQNTLFVTHNWFAELEKLDPKSISFCQECLQHHRAIAEAIEKHDSDGASQAMLRHFNALEEMML